MPRKRLPSNLIGVIALVVLLGSALFGLASCSFGRPAVPSPFQHAVVNGEAEITGYQGDSGSVKVVDMIDKYVVTKIAEGAFQNCTALTEIEIPIGVNSIDAHAFEGCVNLEKVVLLGDPNIGEYAFAGCTSLKSIIIGTGTEWIGDHAFDECTSLEKVDIWSKDTKIGVDAFANCPNLTE